jgi:hypothetical protein
MVTLDHSQRDGIYTFLLHDLANLGELALVLSRGEVQQARHLGTRFKQELRLLDQVGWEKNPDQSEFTISMGLDEIRAVFTRLRELTTVVINEAMTEFANQMLKEAFGVAETCAVVLQELPGGSRPRA